MGAEGVGNARGNVQGHHLLLLLNRRRLDGCEKWGIKCERPRVRNWRLGKIANAQHKRRLLPFIFCRECNTISQKNQEVCIMKNDQNQIVLIK